MILSQALCFRGALRDYASSVPSRTHLQEVDQLESSCLQQVQQFSRAITQDVLKALVFVTEPKKLALEFSSVVREALLVPDKEDATPQGALIPKDLFNRTTEYLKKHHIRIGDEASSNGNGGYTVFDPDSTTGTGWIYSPDDHLTASTLQAIQAALEKESNLWSDKLTQWQAQVQTLQQQYAMQVMLLSDLQSMQYELSQFLIQPRG